MMGIVEIFFFGRISFGATVVIEVVKGAAFHWKVGAEQRRRPRRDPSEKPEWNPAGSQARICCERMQRRSKST